MTWLQQSRDSSIPSLSYQQGRALGRFLDRPINQPPRGGLVEFSASPPFRVGLIPPGPRRLLSAAPSHGDFRRGQPVFERGVRLPRVAVPAPAIDQHARFGQRVEHLARQQLVPQLAVEALRVAVLPGAARLDGDRLCPELDDSHPHGGGRELAATVRVDEPWLTAADEQVCQHVAHVGHTRLAGNADAQRLAGELVALGRPPCPTASCRSAPLW